MTVVERGNILTCPLAVLQRVLSYANGTHPLEVFPLHLRFRLNSGEEDGFAAAIRVGHEDLLGMGFLEALDDGLVELLAVPAIQDDFPLLGLECGLVPVARGDDELVQAVAVQIAYFDLVHEGSRLTVDLLRDPFPVNLAEHGHDTLVVSGDDDLRLPVSRHVANLNVAEPVKLPPERR